MSRAFVSEDAAAADAARLPERPAGTGPNPVTPRGLARINAEVARLAALRDDAAADDPGRPAIERDLRYWRARQASARVVPPGAGTPEAVTFGCSVSVRRAGGVSRYRIVGQDEADPAHGLLSWTSPLAEALLGAQAGDEVEVGAGRPPVIVDAIGPD